MFMKYSLTCMLLCFQLSLLSPKHNLRGNRSTNLSADPDMREQGERLHEAKIFAVGENLNNVSYCNFPFQIELFPNLPAARVQQRGCSFLFT